MTDPAGRLDALHDEMTAAYRAALDSLEECQASGDPTDLERHLADRSRALRLSNSFHLEADLVVLAARSRLDGVG